MNSTLKATLLLLLAMLLLPVPYIVFQGDWFDSLPFNLVGILALFEYIKVIMLPEDRYASLGRDKEKRLDSYTGLISLLVGTSLLFFGIEIGVWSPLFAISLGVVGLYLLVRGISLLRRKRTVRNNGYLN